MFATIVFLAFLSSNGPVSERSIASMEFPRHRLTSDVDDIVDDYSDYLDFVLEIGRDTNPRVAQQIEERFSKLRSQDKRYAARFLKGLRFEIYQRMELVGLVPDRLTTHNPEMRKWVAKYLPAWLREVDEYQFRSYATSVAKRPED